MKILVLDDDEVSRKQLVRFFRKLWHDTIEGTDGWEGLNALRVDDSIELIISDIQMPNLSGIEFVMKLRQTEKWCNKKVILYSGDSSGKTQALVNDLGVYCFLPKPLDIMRLVKVLDEIQRPVK